MDFYEVLDQVIDLLRSRGRVTYSALKRQFGLDDAYIADLKDEIIEAQQLAVDENGRVLVWTGEAGALAEPAPTPSQPAQQPDTQEVQSPQAQPYTPDAERRQLTVMFCDLTDSTKLSGQLDPEDLRDVIRAYQSTSAEVIERYDGYIAQHLGDGLMVYFGWPQAHEDDARRAVHAGLGIREAMKGLNARLEQEKGIRLAVRIGIHTGLVVVGEIGKGASQEHLALGATPNIASRIEGVAARDTVAISHTTYQLVQGYFVCEDLGLHTLKGVGELQHVYQVIKESHAQSRHDVAVTRGLTPLVGRESETTLLLERWQQVKEGQGQVILLGGEAGIGKSRLLQVLRDRVADEPHTRLECRSSPYYQNTALYPITGMLQRMFQWQQDDTPQAKLDKLEQTLRAYRLALDEAIPLFADLLSLTIPEDRYPPLRLSPQRQRQKTLETIVGMLLQQTEQRPVLFIVEDLHWTDPSTLEILDLLIEQVPTASIYTLLTCRPTFQPNWSRRSYMTEVTVNRLSQNQIEHMAEQVAGEKSLPEEVLQQIVEKTDGVPVFVEEMTKAVLESGTLKETDGHYELTGPLISLTIPATLQDSLTARLDRLVTAKAVAQFASVIGRQFSFELLQAVSQLEEATLRRELERLVETEIVYPRGTQPQVAYTFKHALIQDAAYQSLLKRTRQQYHQRIAQVLEGRFPETAELQPELVAYHYTESGLAKEAVGYWQQAGQRAIQRSAHMEAIAHFTKGLTILEALPNAQQYAHQKLELLTMLGPAWIATKGQASPEVQATYSQAYRLCQQVEETPQLFPVLRGLWNFHLMQGKLRTAHELSKQFFSLAQRQQALAPRLWGYIELGLVLFYRGALSEAREYLDQGIALYNPSQYRTQAFLYTQDPGVACLSFAAYIRWLLGYPDQAAQKNHEMLALAREQTNSFSLAYALSFASRVHTLVREVQVTQDQAKAAMSISTELGFPVWLAWGTFMRGWALVQQGRGEEGLAQMQQGLRATRANVLWLPYRHALLAEAYCNMNQIERGLATLVKAFGVVDKTEERFYEAELNRLKGELLLQHSLDSTKEAEACLHQAIHISRQQQAKSWELRAATSLARLWQSQGKRQDAYDLLAPVYGWFTEGFDTADLKEARALLNELG